uniref:Uncharacterized protein LOC103416104 n=1 Tax=Rhizophora mucronata TaxID=61149 RepID=A0A2P2NWZ2_RHIMU
MGKITQQDSANAATHLQKASSMENAGPYVVNKARISKPLECKRNEKS